MPHSSGGGSHGGGTHGGGSHGGSSGPHISHHYFPGSRRYCRHRPGYPDEYIYASAKPQKTSPLVLVILAIFGGIFGYGTFASIKDEIPVKLRPVYDAPDTHIEDGIGVIDNEDDLEEALCGFEDVTGICPVVYTVYDEDWQDGYTDLESYAFDAYVDNYDDEQHFVIVYSIPEDQLADFNSGDLEVPDFAWEAVQGDETDPILTEGMFRHFSKEFHNRLENGVRPGEAFQEAFEVITRNADETLNLKSPLSVVSMAFKCMPFLAVVAFFGLAFFLVIKQFIRDKGVEYEEVPMDFEAERASYAGSGAAAASAERAEAVRKAGKIAAPIIIAVSAIFIVPFIFTGILILIAGISMLSTGGTEAGFMIAFAVVWLLISGGFLAGAIVAARKLKKKAEDQDGEDDYRPASRSDDDDWDRSRYDDYE